MLFLAEVRNLMSKLYCFLLDTDFPWLLLTQLALQQLIPLHHGMHGQGLCLSHQGLNLVRIDLCNIMKTKQSQIVSRCMYHLQYCCCHLLITLTRNTRNHAGGDILLISWHVLDKITLHDLLISFSFRYSQCRASSSWCHHQYNRGGRACFSYAGPSWTFWIE